MSVATPTSVRGFTGAGVGTVDVDESDCAITGVAASNANSTTYRAKSRQKNRVAGRLIDCGHLSTAPRHVRRN